MLAMDTDIVNEVKINIAPNNTVDTKEKIDGLPDTKTDNREEITDEYHYLKSGEYTSEIYKVIVQNIPGKISFGRFRAMMKTILGSVPKKTKFNPKQDYAFLCFRDEDERLKAIEKLNDYDWKGNILLCKKAAPMKDPFVRERKRQALEGSVERSKKQKLDEESSNEPPEERMLHVICPYAKYSYKEQIQFKQTSMAQFVDQLTSRMQREVGKQSKWLKQNEKCMELSPIIQSPILEYYRNKVEFTIGTGPDKKDNTVGFRLGSYKEGSMLIVEGTRCTNCSKESLEMAKAFQTFIQDLSYPSFNIANHIGLWQQLTTRTYSTGDVMLIVQINTSYITDKKEYHELIEKMINFASTKLLSCHVTSMYISSSSQKNNNIDIFEHVYGKKYVTEKLLGLNFQISPDSFFQVNTPAAEVLYNTVKEWCDTDQDDACVLDVCCGTGTIGLCIAHKTNLPVIGVEICQQAVDDAKENASLNGIENAKFICGPAEKVLYDEIKKVKRKNIIAIVDPPRAGLHRNVVSLLRSCNAIQKIIYVACSPKQAADNFIALCRPKSKRFGGIPFKTIRAIPVDLFPQTPHCELIVELERVNLERNITVEKPITPSENVLSTVEKNIDTLQNDEKIDVDTLQTEDVVVKTEERIVTGANTENTSEKC